jgi:uncharacterized membrane protein YcaP (DUF421 family)
MFFSSWSSLLRVAAVGVPAYCALILLLRISGKRTLSKFNAFDLIVTVAFGSTLSAGLLSRDLALADIVAAFALLVLLQFAITWSAVRWSHIDRIIKAEPRLLYYRGEFMRAAMKAERVTEGELLAGIRSNGAAGVEGVHAIVLETDGTLSVVRNAAGGQEAVERLRAADVSPKSR